MFVKQITMDEALKLAAKGKEIMTLVPVDKESSWNEMVPDTLQNMLSGVMFFRREPVLENPMIDSEGNSTPPPRTDEVAAEPSGSTEESKSSSMAAGGKVKKKKPVDTGKVMALRKAGWSMKKIGDELGISEASVFNYLKKMEQEAGM